MTLRVRSPVICRREVGPPVSLLPCVVPGFSLYASPVVDWYGYPGAAPWIPDDFSLPLATLEFWWLANIDKPVGGPASTQDIFCKLTRFDSPASAIGLHVRAEWGIVSTFPSVTYGERSRIDSYWDGSAANDNFTTGFTAANGAHHCAIVVDVAELRLYIDGYRADTHTRTAGNPVFGDAHDAEWDLQITKGNGAGLAPHVAQLRLSNFPRYFSAYDPPPPNLANDSDTIIFFDFHEGTGDQTLDVKRGATLYFQPGYPTGAPDHGQWSTYPFPA